MDVSARAGRVIPFTGKTNGGQPTRAAGRDLHDNTMKTFAKSSLFGLAAGLAALTAAGTTARAERIYGVTDNGAGAAGSLVYFDSLNPALVTTVGAISGATNLRAIDFRPSDGQLYGAGYDNTTGTLQLYTINTSTGVTTAVGASSVLPGFQNSTRLSIDVNPVANALRVITGNGSSYRFNLNTGAFIAQDTTFNGSISGPIFADVAYTNNVPGASSTLLYAYEFINDALVLVNPPNSGTYTQIGTGTGIVSNDAGIGFDISGATGIAYLSLDPSATAGAIDGLYTLNLTTGTTTLVGLTGINLLDILVVAVPEPGTMALVGIAGVVGAVMARRRLRRAAE